jgi:hypothetical protein
MGSNIVKDNHQDSYPKALATMLVYFNPCPGL